jgi:pimeloyl-ACP methyl ester carboxylesterase
MGLGGIKSAWQRQTKFFGHEKGDRYSCLILDNRGMGESDKPFMRYTTSAMASDIVEILNRINWTDDRSVHVIGISMGGMIAQELALLIPTRIASLTLVSTASRIRNTVGFFENIYNRATLFIPQALDVKLHGIKYRLYSDSYLHLEDEIDPVAERYLTNADRCMAIELQKRLDPAVYPKCGFILQLIAAGWHCKSPEQLAELAGKVGHDRIMVIHGTRDRMVSFPLGEELLEGLGGEQAGITKIFIDGQGHVIPIEMGREFNGWVERFIRKTEGMGGKENGVNGVNGVNGLDAVNGRLNGLTVNGSNRPKRPNGLNGRISSNGLNALYGLDESNEVNGFDESETNSMNGTLNGSANGLKGVSWSANASANVSVNGSVGGRSNGSAKRRKR